MTTPRERALAAGEKRYFSGVPCPSGHISERQTCDRHCIACKNESSAARMERWKKSHPDRWKQIHDASQARYYRKNIAR